MKIHIILVDVRYDFDKKTKERYGDLQTQWLDEIFKNHTDADVTLIGMGVQILVDRYFIPESVNWPGKDKLFKLIRKYKKSGVVLLSGDVHFA